MSTISNEHIFALSIADLGHNTPDAHEFYSFSKFPLLKTNDSPYPTAERLFKMPEGVSFDETTKLPLVWDNRGNFEKDDSPYAHFIPYLIITKYLEDGSLGYYTYQRTKLVGEKQLAGNYSCGIGGHPDMTEVPSEILEGFSLVDLFMVGLAKEVREELAVFFTNGDGSTLQPHNDVYEELTAMAELLGFLYDPTNAVGKRHLGAIYHLHIPDFNLGVKVKEAELLDLGFLPQEELAKNADKIENWSSIAVGIISNNLRDIQVRSVD